jgi:hypothetical protein
LSPAAIETKPELALIVGVEDVTATRELLPQQYTAPAPVRPHVKLRPKSPK